VSEKDTPNNEKESNAYILKIAEKKFFKMTDFKKKIKKVLF